MKRKYFLVIILILTTFGWPLKQVYSATIRDNRLNFDTNRLSQEQNETLGQQSNEVKALFDPDTQSQLAESKDGKKVLSTQEHQLFQKGKVVTTSARQTTAKLFQTRGTHFLDIKKGQGEEDWNWLNFWLYIGTIAMVLISAAIFSWWLNKKEDTTNNGIH